MRSRYPAFSLTLAAACLSLMVSVAAAQQGNADPDAMSAQAVRPGDGTISGSRMTAHTNRWKMSYVTPDGQVVSAGTTRIAAWYDTVTFTTLRGTRVLHRKQTLARADGTIMETIDNWVDAKTFAPLRTENHYKSGDAALRDYDGAHVTGFDPDSTAPDKKGKVDVTLAEPAFDFFGGMYDVFVSGLPLHEGYKIRIPTDFGGAPPGAVLQWVTLTVTGKESVATGGPLGTVDTWHIVTGPTPIGKFAFWLSEKSPYMIRMWYIGPRGGKQVWDVDG